MNEKLVCSVFAAILASTASSESCFAVNAMIPAANGMVQIVQNGIGFGQSQVPCVTWPQRHIEISEPSTTGSLSFFSCTPKNAEDAERLRSECEIGDRLLIEAVEKKENQVFLQLKVTVSQDGINKAAIAALKKEPDEDIDTFFYKLFPRTDAATKNAMLPLACSLLERRDKMFELGIFDTILNTDHVTFEKETLRESLQILVTIDRVDYIPEFLIRLKKASNAEYCGDTINDLFVGTAALHRDNSHKILFGLLLTGQVETRTLFKAIKEAGIFNDAFSYLNDIAKKAGEIAQLTGRNADLVSVSVADQVPTIKLPESHRRFMRSKILQYRDATQNANEMENEEVSDQEQDENSDDLFLRRAFKPSSRLVALDSRPLSSGDSEAFSKEPPKRNWNLFAKIKTWLFGRESENHATGEV